MANLVINFLDNTYPARIILFILLMIIEDRVINENIKRIVKVLKLVIAITFLISIISFVLENLIIK